MICFLRDMVGLEDCGLRMLDDGPVSFCATTIFRDEPEARVRQLDDVAFAVNGTVFCFSALRQTERVLRRRGESPQLDCIWVPDLGFCCLARHSIFGGGDALGDVADIGVIDNLGLIENESDALLSRLSKAKSSSMPLIGLRSIVIRRSVKCLSICIILSSSQFSNSPFINLRTPVAMS